MVHDVSRSWAGKGVCVVDIYLSGEGTALDEGVVEAIRVDGYRVIRLEVFPDTVSVVVGFTGGPVGVDSVSLVIGDEFFKREI